MCGVLPTALNGNHVQLFCVPFPSPDIVSTRSDWAALQGPSVRVHPNTSHGIHDDI